MTACIKGAPLLSKSFTVASASGRAPPVTLPLMEADRVAGGRLRFTSASCIPEIWKLGL